jgi:hypothetical protein
VDMRSGYENQIWESDTGSNVISGYENCIPELGA